MKKLFVFCFAMMAGLGMANAETVKIGDLYYSLFSNHTAYVTSGDYSTLTTANIPTSVIYEDITYDVTVIDIRAFKGCSSLRTITIPDGITIGANAFEDCTGLTSVTLPQNTTVISRGLFFNCSNLTSFTIPENVTEIYAEAFYGCTALTSIVIPDKVTNIGESAFSMCVSLSSISFPESVKTLGNDAFMRCYSLTSIEIPNTITSFGESVFYRVPNIIYSGSSSEAPWGAQSMNGYVDDKWVYSDASKKTLLAGAVYNERDVIIPDGVTSLERESFYGYENLNTIIIPNSVTYIGENAFLECFNLASVDIPNSVTDIGYGAFDYCSNLTTITCRAVAPPTIDYDAFMNVGKTIPLYVPAVSIDAYKTASSWKNFTNILPIEEEPASCIIASGNCGAEGDNVTWELSRDSVLAFETTNGYDAMEDYYVFEGDNRIYSPWYYYQSYIKSVIFSYGITHIGECAFRFCDHLKSVIIPGSIISVGHSAFRDCSKLSSVIFENSTEPYNITIGPWAFCYCSNLTSVTIGNHIGSIENGAFSNCSNLTKITCKAISPPILGSDVFYSVDKSIPLYVPAESVDAYKAADQWKDFTNIQAIEGEWNPEHPNNPGNYKLTLEVSDTLKGYTVGAGLYEQGATAHIEAIAKNGYRFVRWSDNDSTAVRDIVIIRDCTLVASFTERDYSVLFADYNGDTLQWTTELYGSMPAYQGETPVRAATELYEYSFAGWYPMIGVVAQDTVYTAVYDSVFLGEATVYVHGFRDIKELPVGRNTHIIVGTNGDLYVSQPTAIKALTIHKDTMCGEVQGIKQLTMEQMDFVQTFFSYDNDISSRWFAFAVPFEVSVSNGVRTIYPDRAAVYGSDFVIDEYDGSLRASTQDGWKRVSSTATLYPGKLYMLASHEATEWRFTATDPSTCTENHYVNVQAYPSELGDHHAGWNGIANPLTENATSASVSGAEYATIFDNYYAVYKVVPLNNSGFKAFDPLFVQMPVDDAIYFSTPLYNSGSGNQDPAYVSRRESLLNDAPYTIELSGPTGTYADKAYITANPDKAEQYTIGEDLEKMQVQNPSVPQIWIEAYGMHLAAHGIAVEENNDVQLTLGFYAPVEGTYTLKINDAPDNVTFCLTQNGYTVTELSKNTYMLHLAAGTDDSYGVKLHYAPDAATGVEEVPSDQVQSTKVIENGQLYIRYKGTKYNVLGQVER